MNKWIVSFFSLWALSACTLPYRATVQQGNVLQQSIMKRLEIGMTEPQVHYLLGSCVLNPTFQVDRSDYVYFYQPGRGKATLRRLTLFFSKGRLVRIVKS